jgi:hypothetical protein
LPLLADSRPENRERLAGGVLREVFNMAGTYRATIIRYLNSQGQRVSKEAQGTKRVRQKSKTFWGRCADADGEVRQVALSDDEDAAEEMLAAM